MGILYLLALSGMGVYGVILSGWSSNSKYALLGGLRAAAQMISYEIAISLCILPVVLITGSLNLSDIVYFQIKNIYNIVPLFPLCFIFFICILAETNRAPFDLPEAEAEIVAGYNLELRNFICNVFFRGVRKYDCNVSCTGHFIFRGLVIPFSRYFFRGVYFCS